MCLESSVEPFHGKDEVPGSNPGRGSRYNLGFITPTLCGGFLVPIGVIYRQVDNSIGTVTNYGLPVKSFNNLI